MTEEDDMPASPGSPTARGVIAWELDGALSRSDELKKADHILSALRAHGFVVLSHEQIHQMGDMGDFCTEDLTGVRCPGCRCKKGASASEPAAAAASPDPKVVS